ncbi:hypothetical protein AB0M23_01840 [Streptomyces sp. NPDC052077]|uniref:hypothetical protein n=1 Tax=Streptomyces sp. NPDC052077 TaxID=3154757 RepID=UPI00343ACE49
MGRECQRFRFEGVHGGTSGALFPFAMGLSVVAIPPYAWRSGYSGGEVGVPVALSACAQPGSRAAIGALSRQRADKHLAGGAALPMTLSCAVLTPSNGPAAFVASQLAQDAAREGASP